LAFKVNEFEERIRYALLFPCAVSEREDIVNFENDDSSSAVTATGNRKVSAVKLDDVLMSFRPTFIKMDIEGSEPDALRGGRKLIETYRPNLAVCVYHSINHYWEIPLLLRSWALDYRFYLRSHYAATLETVLYAVPEGA
jgi:hypothetical protein